jgi:hypothetical protein
MNTEQSVEWDTVKSDDGQLLKRAKVDGGWLWLHLQAYRVFDLEGRVDLEFRNAITFQPDP